MQPEQQRRIMGYFIEEAKDHLNTIEQGLLNLQGTIADPEMVNEVFRAAHSVKGGAAMLGLSSIQQTSHRLEDFFKILKDTPGIKPDQKVETLLLRVFDTLQELLEQLQGPFGLSEEASNATMASVEPVFEELQQHLNLLERQGEAATPTPVMTREPTIAATPATSQDSSLVLIFQTDVPVQLRQMLQLFRQAETLPDGRDRLQEICTGLRGLGEAFDLDQWCSLVNLASQAIADPNNSYRTLAPIVIKDFKQAQESVLAGRVWEVAPSEQLIALVPIDAALPLAVDDDLADFFAITDHLDSDDDLDLSGLDFAAEADSLDSLGLDALNLDAPLFKSSRDSSLVEETELSRASDRDGPEVGMAELNSLADLFEGEMPDLGATWQEEEVIGSSRSAALDFNNPLGEESSDFSDLLFDDSAATPASVSEDDDDLTSLFGDNSLEDLLDSEVTSGAIVNPTILETASDTEDFDLFGLETSEESLTPADNLFDELNLDDFDDLNLTSEIAPSDDLLEILSSPQVDNEATPIGLGELFAGLDEEELNFDQPLTDSIASPSPVVDESTFDDLDFDLALDDEAPAPAAAISDPWESLDLEESPQASTLESDNQNELGALTDDLFGDLDDLDFGLNEAPSTSVESLEALSLPPDDQETNDLSPFDNLWSQSDLLPDDESLDAELEELDVGSDTSNFSVEDSNDLLTDARSDDSAEFDLTSANSEFPFSLEIASEESDDLLTSLFDSEEPLDSLEINPVEPEASLNELAFDGVFEFDLTLDDLNSLTEESESEPNALPNLELTDLDDDFLGLEGEDEIDLANLVDESFAAETPSLSLDADSESETADLAGLLESEDLFNFNQSEESLDLNLNASETSDDLDSLFDENSEEMGLLFAETPISELETTDLFGFLTADDPQASEESIADSPLSLDRSESEPLSNDLDDLLNLTAIGEETALDLDLLLDDDSLNSLDDLLSDDLGSELTKQTFDLSLNLESELFETAYYQENEPLEIPDEFGSIAAQSVFGLDPDELSLESSTDDLDELNFDLFSSSEDMTSEPDTLDTLLNDLGLDSPIEAVSVQNIGEADDLDLLFDLEDSTSSAENDDFDLEFDPFDDSALALSDFEPLETEASSTEPADPSDLDSLFGASIAAASVISLGAAMAASLNLDESDENDSELNVLETESNLATDDEFGDLDDLLNATLSSTSEPSDPEDFDDLDSLFGEETADSVAEAESLDTLLDETPANFDDLDDLLGDDLSPIAQDLTFENFDDLESLLADAPETFATTAQTGFSATDDSDMEFDDLEKMLEDADKTMGGTPAAKSLTSTQSARRTNRLGKGLSEQTMRVPVKHLDNLSNLVGELVVNRNSLEQDQERLRQSLDNLLYQVQQLSDVGQRMQDLYERSLLESSLLASRNQRTPSIFSASIRDSSAIAPSNSSGVEYDPLEMDRFTGFHSLSQEMIELIVRVRESASDIEFIVDETDQVTRMFRQVTTQLQEGLTRSRMVPFAQTADRLPRAVRDIAMKCGKQAELVIEGRDTLIDKMILEHLYDPMTHLVNNAITHGIETPDVRRAAGKSPVGKITIRAFHQGNQTVISVSDDGAGVDIERVKVKAIEKGLITSSESKAMARLDIYDLLFHPGFTTKDQADDFSGRGVGMDVVRTSLSEIRGVINTDSALSKGTTFTVRLPLTLSISKALCCISDRARIAFPMDGVEDMLDIPKERIQTDSEGNPVIAWRDAILPLRPLTDLLGYSRHLSRGNVYGGNQEDDMVSVVVLRSAGNYLALQVDQVLGEQEIVIKQLEGPVPKPIGVAGATVLGDGRIMPIADVLELIDLSMGRIRRDVGTMWDQGASQSTDTITMKTEPTVLIVDDSITVRELLSMTFNKVGYRVEQARDGQEAWEKLRAGLPCDIVFCDIEMPRMDGLELLSRIQKDPNLSSLPIAMLTSRGADRHRQMAASLGASGYFTKPYLEEALLDAAQRMLKGEILIVNNRDS